MDINFSDETIQAAIIGVVGAIIAAFLASYLTIKLTKWKEKNEAKNRIKRVNISLCSILKNNILNQLYAYVNLCSEAKESISNNFGDLINYGSDMKGLDIDFVSYLGKDDVMKLFISKKIEISILIHLQFSLSRIVVTPPSKVIDNLEKNNELIKERKRQFLQEHNSIENIEYAKNKSQSDREKAIETAIKNLDDYIQSGNKQITTIKWLLKKLES